MITRNMKGFFAGLPCFFIFSAGGVSNGSARAEQRSREEMQQYIGRNFPSHAFQTPVSRLPGYFVMLKVNIL